MRTIAIAALLVAAMAIRRSMELADFAVYAAQGSPPDEYIVSRESVH